jgi:type VI secretion system protein ImpF
MAELTPSERLQPSLLDRLTDREPQRAVESRQERVLSTNQLRESVIRDLAWLMSTSDLDSVIDLEDYPYVRDSVLNFGVRDLTGRTTSDLTNVDLQMLVRDAIRRFEPRILPDSIRVEARVAEYDMSRNALAFDIRAELWAQPMPERMFLRTELDLETHQVKVTENPGHA